jgi:dihydroorotate dehydrogenase
MYFIAAPFGNYLKIKDFKSVSGSWTLSPRPGRVSQIIKTLRYKNGCWYNAIGLRNPGIDYALKKYAPNEVMSLAAINDGDWEKLCEKVPQNQSLELNLSCPNIEKFDSYLNGIEYFINDKREYLIVKISPLTNNIILNQLIKLGFKTFHASNTLPTEFGGQSGHVLIPYTLRIIHTIRQNFSSEIEIIAGGGVQNIDDANKYLNEGANHVSIGTLCFHPFKLKKFLNNI